MRKLRINEYGEIVEVKENKTRASSTRHSTQQNIQIPARKQTLWEKIKEFFKS